MIGGAEFHIGDRAPDSPLEPEELAELARIADSLLMVVRLIRSSRVIEDLELVNIAVDAVMNGEDDPTPASESDRPPVTPELINQWIAESREENGGSPS